MKRIFLATFCLLLMVTAGAQEKKLLRGFDGGMMVQTKDLGVPFSVSSCKSMIHNACMLERFICVSGLRPNPQVIDKLFNELVLFTSRAA